MHIALTGPVTLDLLDSHVSVPKGVSGYPFSGTAQLALEYVRQGHRVSVVTTSPDGVTVPTFLPGEELDVTVVPSRTRARDRALDLFRDERRLLTAALLSLNAEVCHAHWTYEFALAAQETDLPLVTTVHDWAPRVAIQNRHPYWWFRFLMQARALMGRGIVSAPSPYIRQRVEKWYRRDCHLIPNGIPLGAYHGISATSRPFNGIPEIGMLNVGHSRRKNIFTALEALAKVASVTPIVVRLAGPGYEPGGEVHHWLRERNMDKYFSLEGPLSPLQVPHWMTELDLFVHPSHEESFGLVLVEAMAAGTPVIAGRNSGAVPWVVGQAGRLVDVSAAATLETAVLDLLENESQRQELANRGRDRAEAFDLTIVAAKFIELFDG